MRGNPIVAQFFKPRERFVVVADADQQQVNLAADVERVLVRFTCRR